MELYVDVEALSQVACRLQAIKDALNEAEDSISGGDFGSPRIHDAVDKFVDGWKDGRREIIEGIDSQMARIRGAVCAYRDNERAIRRAADVSP